MTKPKPTIKSHSITYPWISVFSALACVSYLYLSTQPDLQASYQIPHLLFGPAFIYGVIGLFFVILICDARFFQRRLKAHLNAVAKLDEQINELLIIKKQLQNKAHTFAGHADKLKLFISDRLLEYIEYDEKFLHFKSIASEVRHNGVICFDKVQTALTQAINGSSDSENSQYKEAMESMIYLWDLLELSTTDNLALHISNQLCECEEQYYQSLLDDDMLSSDLSSPTFMAHLPIFSAINPIIETPILRKINADTWKADKSPIIIEDDKQFWIRIEKTKQLLGNENHIILLLENLINNAVFYANKKPYAQKYSKVAVQVINHEGNIRYSVYNNGPHIEDKDKEQIFQLGYSTRRVRENNGKGLGLYFVNEIIKGYEGKIYFNNISNEEAIYSIRLAFENNTVTTDIIETKIENNKILCKRSTDSTFTSQIEWSSKEKVISIEVTTQTTRKTYSFNDLEDKYNRHTDPEDPSMPRWFVESTRKIRAHKVTFAPLDIHGVRFIVDLPSAESRLDYSNSFDEYSETGEQDLASLKENFLAPDEMDERTI